MARLHLDEDQLGPFTGDDIDLSLRESHVAVHDLIAAPEERVRRVGLAEAPEVSRCGRCGVPSRRSCSRRRPGETSGDGWRTGRARQAPDGAPAFHSPCDARIRTRDTYLLLSP